MPFSEWESEPGKPCHSPSPGSRISSVMVLPHHKKEELVELTRQRSRCRLQNRHVRLVLSRQLGMEGPLNVGGSGVADKNFRRSATAQKHPGMGINSPLVFLRNSSLHPLIPKQIW